MAKPWGKLAAMVLLANAMLVLYMLVGSRAGDGLGFRLSGVRNGLGGRNAGVSDSLVSHTLVISLSLLDHAKHHQE